VGFLAHLRQCQLLPSLGVRRPLTFHILIFSSETPQPNELKLGRKHLNRDKMSNLYRGPSIDAYYQVSVHLAKGFQRRLFLEINQSETRIACVGQVYDWSDLLTNMAAIANSCFWLVDL
jgi:hypothetical protein